MGWRTFQTLFLVAFIIAVFVLNESLLFYVTVWNCSWPCGDEGCASEDLKVFMISDTHLLGKRNGHWLDKLKREWQMRQSFKHSVAIHQPDVVFFLGDLLDEGKWAEDAIKFKEYANQFKNIFGQVNNAGDKPEIIVVAGNHDLGFHESIRNGLVESFRFEFKRTLVDEVFIRGQRFVLITSMALEGDGCRLCQEAEQRLQELRNEKPPIILQHYPMYRKSDSVCEQFDDLHEIDHEEIYRPKWDTISEESSKKLIYWLKPRAVFDGHSHKMCKRRWRSVGYDFYEYTVNSFSWRNNDRPAFLMAVINDKKVAVNSCRLPSEITQIGIYVIAGIIVVIWFVCIFSDKTRALLKHYFALPFRSTGIKYD